MNSSISRLLATRQTIAVAAKHASSPQNLVAMHVKIALQELSRVRAENRRRAGVDIPHVQYVDGVKDAALTSVRPGGVIMFKFNNLNEVVDAVLQELMVLSPVGPTEEGHYRDDHWLFVNGVRVDVSPTGSEVQINPRDEVVIANLRKYARKLEQGLSTKAPDGVYEITSRLMKRRFVGFADIRFEYRQFPGYRAGRVRNSRRNAVQRSESYPCIVIKGV